MQDSASIKNLLSLNSYYPKTHFGFAAGKLGLSAERIRECIDRKNFSAAELPYEYLASLSSAAKKRLRSRFPMIHCGSFLVPELTALILGAGEKIREDLIRTCRGMVYKLSADGIRYGTLDLALVRMLQDDSLREIAGSLLRKLHPVLLETSFTLLLPVRLPLPGSLPKESLTRFLRDEMIAGLKLSLEIYPHELKPDFRPEELAGTFRLETGSVMFCCNADSGNRFLRAHLAPWLRYFALSAFPGPFLFCPFSRDNRLAPAESEALSDLTGEITKNCEREK